MPSIWVSYVVIVNKLWNKPWFEMPLLSRDVFNDVIYFIDSITQGLFYANQEAFNLTDMVREYLFPYLDDNTKKRKKWFILIHFQKQSKWLMIHATLGNNLR